MKVIAGKKGELVLREVFNPVTLRIRDEEFSIAMRDAGFEFRYNGVDYVARGGVIETGGKKIAAEPKAAVGAATGVTAGAVDRDLRNIKYNVEVASKFGGLNSGGFYWGLSNLLTHRQEVANKLLIAAKNPQADGVIKALHDAFEYDQGQLRQILGMTLSGD